MYLVGNCPTVWIKQKPKSGHGNGLSTLGESMPKLHRLESTLVRRGVAIPVARDCEFPNLSTVHTEQLEFYKGHATVDSLIPLYAGCTARIA
jgi:hypothetical protein